MLQANPLTLHILRERSQLTRAFSVPVRLAPVYSPMVLRQRTPASKECGFNPSMQQIDESAQPVYRSLVSFVDAH